MSGNGAECKGRDTYERPKCPSLSFFSALSGFVVLASNSSLSSARFCRLSIMSLVALSALLAAAASVATAQITDPTQTFPATPLASKHFSYPTGVVSVLALFTSAELPRCASLVRG